MESFGYIDFIAVVLATIEVALVVLIFIVAYFGFTERRSIEKVLRGGVVQEELEKLMRSSKGKEILEEIIDSQANKSPEEEEK